MNSEHAMRGVGTFVLAALIFVVASGAQAQQQRFRGKTLIVAGAAGALVNDPIKQGVQKRFEDETGASLQIIDGSSVANFTQILASRGHPPFQVAMLENPTQGQAASLNIIQKLDYTKIPNIKNLSPQSFPHPGYGPIFIFSRMGNCVNTKELALNNIPLPNSVDVWFDPRFAGHITLPDPANFWWFPGLVAMAAHYQLSPDNPGPLFDRIAAIKSQGFFTSSGQAQARLQSGEAWIAPTTDARCYSMKMAGQPTEFVPLNLRVDGKTYKWIGMGDTWEIPVGVDGDLRELAYIFINMTLENDAMLPLARKMGFMPAATEGLRKASEFPEWKAANVIPSDFNLNSLYQANTDAAQPYLDKWIALWNQKMLK